MMNCVFCKILNHEIPAFTVWEDDNHMAFLDINPINPGHIDIIPKQHVDYVFDLDEESYNAIFLLARKLAPPLKKATNAKRIGVAVEGFGVPHVHIHLVPLHGGMELDPNRSKQATNEELAEMCGKIRKEISD